MRPSRLKNAAAKTCALAALLTAGLLAGCTTPEQVAGPNWAGPPETRAGQEYTPQAASNRNVAGWVLLRCVIGEGQSAQRCFILVETPTGWGFGDSALRTSEHMNIRSAQNYGGDHVPVPGEAFNLPIFFCPATRSTCQAELREQVRDFLTTFHAVQDLVRAKDCPAALRMASATGYQPFDRLVVQECAPKP